MTYELAKQLKDAGFPQNTHHHYFSISKDMKWEYELRCGGIFNTEHDIACPTLSELIEACAAKMAAMNTFEEKHWMEFWFNYGYDNKVFEWAAGHAHGADRDEADQENYFGSTPEEAVAKLWLALNANESQI